MNSAGGSFGLSFGLAMAGGVLLATLSLAFTHMTESSDVIPPAQQQQIADTLEHDAQVVSNTQLERAARRRTPRPCRTRSCASTTTRPSSRCRSPCSCRSSPACSGCCNAFRMMRLPDIKPSAELEGAALG